MIRVVQILLDGLGDRAWPALDGLTPLEAADTPNLDALAAAGVTGLLHPLGRGVAPPSERGHWALFGYGPELFPGRAYFGALADDIALEPGDVVLWAMLGRVEPQPDGTLLATRREVPLPPERVAELAALVPPVDSGDLRAELVLAGRHLYVRVRGAEASAAVTDSYPFRDGEPVVRVLPLAEARDARAASVTAALLERFLAEAHIALRGSAADFITTKWAGQDTAAPAFAEHAGFDAAMVSAGSLYHGLALRLGMRWIGVPDEPDEATAFARRVEAGLAVLEDGCDYVHVHTKAPDEAGHTKDPARKRDALTALDAALAPLLPGRVPPDTLVVVTGDHGTPAGTRLIHSADAVPLLIAGPGVTPDSAERFGERACMRGGLGHLDGVELLPTLLDLAERSAFAGSRLTPERTLHQPVAPEPFRLPRG